MASISSERKNHVPENLVTSDPVITLALPGSLPAAVAEQFLGIGYGPYHHGESPGTAISNSQFLADLNSLSTYLPQFTHIRTYEVSAASRLDKLIPLAAVNYPNYKFAVGVNELSSNRTETLTQLQTAWTLANTYTNVYAIVVGNECTPSDTFNPERVSIETLTADLDLVKSNLTNANVKVTTGLSYAGANDYGLTLAPHTDVLMVHVYPFYAGPGQTGVDINQAMDNLFNDTYGFTAFVNKFAPKEVILGETGWPSGPTGSPYGASVPGVPNQSTYTANLVAELQQRGYSGFAFEAFDESWKTSENVWGPHWGLLNADGSPKGTFYSKYDFNYLLQQRQRRLLHRLCLCPYLLPDQ